MGKSVTIVGGGLAGLTLGIGLRQRGVPVWIWEAGRYPRHRVCGEFISGLGQESLARLGLLEGLKKVDVREAVDAAFFRGKSAMPARLLPEPALCVSRHFLDEWLAVKFQRLDGVMNSSERWQGDFGDGVVRATGRRAEGLADGWRWFGLKVHARGVELSADLEMHLVPGGYVGLCRLPKGEVNVCGLFRSRVPVPDLARRWREWLGGPTGSTLHARLATAQFDDESFCSVAGLSLRPRCASGLREFSVGDALTMIPPVTGNGMSMAFESAELSIEPLVQYSEGRLTWTQAQQQVARACDLRFARRLRWAGWLQGALFQPVVRSVLFQAAVRSGWLWRAMVKRTR